MFHKVLLKNNTMEIIKKNLNLFIPSNYKSVHLYKIIFSMKIIRMFTNVIYNNKSNRHSEDRGPKAKDHYPNRHYKRPHSLLLGQVSKKCNQFFDDLLLLPIRMSEMFRYFLLLREKPSMRHPLDTNRMSLKRTLHWCQTY